MISNFTLTAQIGYRQCVLVLRRVSIPTNASVYCSMVRPPCMRLGSVRPSNPRTLLRVQGGPPAYGPTDITSEPTRAVQHLRGNRSWCPNSAREVGRCPKVNRMIP
jgi:hypothetical protein